MTALRTSFFEQHLKTPRGRLDKLCRTTRLLASTAVPIRMIDDQEYDRYETVAEVKLWADRQHAATGIYPDGEVQKFLAKFS